MRVASEAAAGTVPAALQGERITPRTIMVTNELSEGAGGAVLGDARTYAEADRLISTFLASLRGHHRLYLRAVVVFSDLFVWSSSITVSSEDSMRAHFAQRAILADWEFNAGVRPEWWPHTIEADRMWLVHFREDRDNGRAELARMRLERYDLSPMRLTTLPARKARGD